MSASRWARQSQPQSPAWVGGRDYNLAFSSPGPEAVSPARPGPLAIIIIFPPEKPIYEYVYVKNPYIYIIISTLKNLFSPPPPPGRPTYRRGRMVHQGSQCPGVEIVDDLRLHGHALNSAMHPGGGQKKGAVATHLPTPTPCVQHCQVKPAPLPETCPTFLLPASCFLLSYFSTFLLSYFLLPTSYSVLHTAF